MGVIGFGSPMMITGIGSQQPNPIIQTQIPRGRPPLRTNI